MNPSTQSNSPVIAVARVIVIKVGRSRSVLPLATRRAAMAATRVAVTAEVEVSGPAMANGSELRHATTAAPMAADRNVMAMP